MKTGFTKPIKNIVFDFDETLVHKTPHLSTFIQDYLETRGFVLTNDQIRQAGLWSSKFWEDTETHVSDPDRGDGENGMMFWLNYLQYYYEILQVPGKSLQDMFTDLASRIEKEPKVEVLGNSTREVLASLVKKGYKVGVLSNRHSSLIPAIESYQLSDYFQCVYSAGELGIAKPDPEIFHIYLEKFGGKPEETIYVGDNFWLDVLPAHNAGIHPVLLDPYCWHGEIDFPVIQDLSYLDNYLDTQNS